MTRHPFALMTILLALLAGGCTTLDAPPAQVRVPDKLSAGSGETLQMIVPAKGVQIYECRARYGQSGAHEWTFVAPEANLYDARGNRIGRHYGGPHWEANDGSKIIGTLKERADAPTSDAIPWLLLTAKSVGREGAFGKITSVQRVNTVGGVAPTNGCTSANAGMTARIAYTADYYFFGAL